MGKKVLVVGKKVLVVVVTPLLMGLYRCLKRKEERRKRDEKKANYAALLPMGSSAKKNKSMHQIKDFIYYKFLKEK